MSLRAIFALSVIALISPRRFSEWEKFPLIFFSSSEESVLRERDRTSVEVSSERMFIFFVSSNGNCS